MNDSKCRSCGKAVLILKHRKTLKPTVIDVRGSPLYNLVISRELGLYRVATKEERQEAKETARLLYRSHFVSCPDAKEWRERNR